jgi:hypothetical protein
MKSKSQMKRLIAQGAIKESDIEECCGCGSEVEPEPEPEEVVEVIEEACESCSGCDVHSIHPGYVPSDTEDDGETD